MQGTVANRPTAGVADRVYYATDEEIAYIDDGSVWRVYGMAAKRKAADETVTSSTALQDDDDLYFSLNANEDCIFEFVVFFYTADANPDIKVAVTASAGVSNIRYSVQFMDASPTDVADGSIQTASGGSDDHDYAGSCESVIYIRGSVENAGAANTISLQWAQRVSNAAATTVREGSYVLWKLVG
jgi:hypothetical protein